MNDEELTCESPGCAAVFAVDGRADGSRRRWPGPVGVG
jgi:hypothetical protein